MKFLKWNRPRLDSRRIIHQTMLWSKAFVPVIALLAAIASSIRTIQTTAQIYRESGSPEFAVVIAALAFTLSVEGALFLLALAQENQNIKWRMAHKKRHVTTIRTIAYAIGVRLGLREPLSYDQMPESDGGLSSLILIAFLFAIASNFYLGLKPLTEQIGSASLQSFIGKILNADAGLQLTFIVDLAGVLFPPFMALKAGHLTARFAAEVASSQNRANASPAVRPERAKASAATMPERSDKYSKGVQLSARERVIEYLNTHPEQTNQHEVARQTGVSIGTVNSVFRSRLSNGWPEQVKKQTKEHE